MASVGEALSKIFAGNHISDLSPTAPSALYNPFSTGNTAADPTNLPLLQQCGTDYFLNNYYQPCLQPSTSLPNYSTTPQLNWNNMNLATLQQALCGLQQQQAMQQCQQQQHNAYQQDAKQWKTTPPSSTPQVPQTTYSSQSQSITAPITASHTRSTSTDVNRMASDRCDNMILGAYSNHVLEHANSPPEKARYGRALRGSVDWCSPIKMEPHLASTPSGSGSHNDTHNSSGTQRSSSFNSTDTSGISSDASASSDGVVFMRALNLDNPLMKKLEEQKKLQDQEASRSNRHSPPGIYSLRGRDSGVSNTNNLQQTNGKLNRSHLESISEEDTSSVHRSLLEIRRMSSSPQDMHSESIREFANMQRESSDKNNTYQNIEIAAKMHRHAASSHDATCTWSGILPPRIYKNPHHSCKVFLGGVPWDITTVAIQKAFQPFGHVKIEWPGNMNNPKHQHFPMRGTSDHPIFNPQCFGYLYVIFDSDRSVKSMLQACTRDFRNGGEYYFKISSRRIKCKEVQVIPWELSDSNYVIHNAQRLDNETTVFVGALHGMLNAEGLAHVMNDLFGNVVYAGVDTDRYKYPIGSGRVTFCSHKSYMKAVNAAFVEIKTSKFAKKVQIDPYLEESLCSKCCAVPGPYFCRNPACFQYYCAQCWSWKHRSIDPNTGVHKPLSRNTKNGTRAAAFRQLPEIAAAEIRPVQNHGGDMVHQM